MKIDFLTVVYKPEIDLLINQGASFDLRVKSENVDNIFIIINDDDINLVDSIDPTWYKKHSSKVKILTRQDINYIPGEQEQGWHTQQMVKLLGVAQSNNDWVMVFDSKTWFARDFHIEKMFDGNRSKCGLIPWNDWFKVGGQKYAKLLGVETQCGIWPNGVPHIMKPAVTRNMMQYTSELVKKPFQQFFEENNKDRDMITEFICYDVYCQWSGDYEKHYVDGNFNVNVKNLADHEIENFEIWLQSLIKERPLTVSIKSAAFPLMSEQQLTKWHHYLLSIGLK